MSKTNLRTKLVSVTPVIDTAIYADGDAVGDLLEFASALVDNSTGVILTVTVKEETDTPNKSALELVLFSKFFTVTADNAAFNPSDTDLLNCLGVIPISASDYSEFANNAIATVKNIGLTVENTQERGSKPTAGVIYGQLVSRGTPTYGAVDDLTITLGVLQD